MASYSRAAQQWATFARAWYLLDAKMQPPGKIAAATVIRLEGRHKPIYHALNDCGDHVVIINTRHIAFSGNKWEQKVYSSHTGYPGGFKQVTATQLHLKDPTAIVKLAVYRMLPKNLQRRTLMQRLHLFPDDVIPEDIEKNLLQEIPQPRAVPKRLDEYTPEEIAAFPKVWTPSLRGAFSILLCACWSLGAPFGYPPCEATDSRGSQLNGFHLFLYRSELWLSKMRTCKERLAVCQRQSLFV